MSKFFLKIIKSLNFWCGFSLGIMLSAGIISAYFYLAKPLLFPYEHMIRDVGNTIGWKKVREVADKTLRSDVAEGYLPGSDPSYLLFSKYGVRLTLKRPKDNKKNDYIFIPVSRAFMEPSGIIVGCPGFVPADCSTKREELGWKGSGIWGLH